MKSHTAVGERWYTGSDTTLSVLVCFLRLDPGLVVEVVLCEKTDYDDYCCCSGGVAEATRRESRTVRCDTVEDFAAVCFVAVD